MAIVPPKRLRIGQELAANPYDVELQRIYADVLLEEGGEHAIRGELIQIELAGGNTARRLELAAKLARSREARGLGGLSGRGDHIGLALYWSCSAHQLATCGARAFDEEPLLEWITIQLRTLDDPQREMRKLAATPILARLRRLCILGCEGTRPGAKGLATLLASPHWPRLVSLRLPNCRIFDAGAELLARSPSLADVVWLDLWANGVKSDGVIALARSPFLAKVEHLLLWGNSPGPAGLAALAAAENPMQLSQLDVEESEQTPELVAALVKRFPGIEIRSKLPDEPEPEEAPWPFDRSPFD